mmetsp:Transcript_11423/g.19297  ORF Transcript_11423/g.19297 Transcript_11423/m.19297 type:complete len:265 (-) Transcript_11423:1505-2299(-)
MLGQMKDVGKQTKVEILKQELIQINQHLPASVYIPFVQNSTRNFCVLHIPPEEARVFQTKERAPIMLAIEVYRPDEMLLILKQNRNKKLLRDLGTMKPISQKQLNSLRGQYPDNPYLKLDYQSSNDSEEELKDDARSFKSGMRSTKLKQGIQSKGKRLKEIFKGKRLTSKVEGPKKSSLEQRIKKAADQQISKPMVLKQQKEDPEEFEKMFGRTNYLMDSQVNLREKGKGGLISTPGSRFNNTFIETARNPLSQAMTPRDHTKR